MKKIAIFLATLLISVQAHAAVLVGFGSNTSEWGIDDSYASDTSSSYTRFSGSATLSISGGLAKTLNYNMSGYFAHNTSLGSKNMTVRGIVCDGSGNENRTGLVVRSNGSSSGHACFIEPGNNRIVCQTSGGGTEIYRSIASSSWSDGACHVMQVSVDSDDLYTFKIDLNDDGDFLDTNENPGTATNSSYSGQYAGIAFYYTAISDDVYVDNFKAKRDD